MWESGRIRGAGVEEWKDTYNGCANIMITTATISFKMAAII